MPGKNIYVFSGLGADERAFRYIDFSGHDVTFIKWSDPGDASIETYATKLLSQITSSNPVLIGLSFGGIIAIEVAKQIETEKIILIASAKTQDEIPFYFRLMGSLRLHKFFSLELMKQPSRLNNWLFGAESEQDKKLLAEILNDTDIRFMKWAVEKMGNWKNTIIPKNVTHIHGTADRILPYRFVSCNVTVVNGGHFMLVNKSEKLSAFIRMIL